MPTTTFADSYEELSTLLVTTLKALTLITPDVPRVAIGSAIASRKSSGKSHQWLEQVLQETFPGNLPNDFVSKDELVKCVERLIEAGKAKT